MTEYKKQLLRKQQEHFNNWAWFIIFSGLIGAIIWAVCNGTSQLL